MNHECKLNLNVVDWQTDRQTDGRTSLESCLPTVWGGPGLNNAWARRCVRKQVLCISQNALSGLAYIFSKWRVKNIEDVIKVLEWLFYWLELTVTVSVFTLLHLELYQITSLFSVRCAMKQLNIGDTIFYIKLWNMLSVTKYLQTDWVVCNTLRVITFTYFSNPKTWLFRCFSLCYCMPFSVERCATGTVARCMRRHRSSTQPPSARLATASSTRGRWMHRSCIFPAASGSKWAETPTFSGSSFKCTTRTSHRFFRQVSHVTGKWRKVGVCNLLRLWHGYSYKASCARPG